MTRHLIRLHSFHVAASLAVCTAFGFAAHAQTEPPPPALQTLISVYNNRSSYDELSDNIPLTETLAMRERTADGYMRRTWAGGPPSGENMGKVFTIDATREGRVIPVVIDYGKIVWSGLSWAVGEIKAADLAPDEPVLVRFYSTEKDPVKLDGAAYQVLY